jgi:hypothetical protein
MTDRISKEKRSWLMSRCIESAQTHRARVCSLLTRASDTSLTTPAGSRVFYSGSSLVLAHHNLLRNLRSCSADDSPQLLIFHSCPTYFARTPCHFIDSVLPHQTSLRSQWTTMIYSNSLRIREAGSPFNTPVTADQDHLSARHSRTGITAFLPQLSAAAEFLVVNLIA